ncbi:ArsR/SmtB family transcription factor [Acinetobacter larvae]|uniref:Transcriptional regulator n=1 Tax=Acinetobacter larvae TaxID=1789224 RepID=A0A1B2M358_9GAMM|nr:metalloregulator ArsR/SmtB family transcription factor [Acinetobacter larvae]AOA59638.1 transcriptional regulator [Acinetobacter larvae]
MDHEFVFKALANPLRRQILHWLKNPAQYFPAEACLDLEHGICAGQIEQLGHVSQSTMSNHLAVLHQAGLLQLHKRGQWCYFSRNEQNIQQFIQSIQQSL